MSRLILSAYKLAMRVQGSYMMLVIGLSFFTMPIFVLDGVLARSLVMTLIALVVALWLRRPHWQLAFLHAPQGIIQGFGAMLMSFVVFVVSVMIGYLAVINMNLDEPLSRQLAILTALPSLLVTGVMFWSALLLAVLPRNDATPPRVTPRRPTRMRPI